MVDGDERVSSQLDIIDCCVHQAWASPIEVVDYLDRGWHEFVISRFTVDWQDHLRGRGERPAVMGPNPLTPMHAYRYPGPAKLAGGNGHPDASVTTDPARLVDEYLAPRGIARAVMCNDVAMMIPGLPNPRLSVALSRAINDWTVDRWLGDSSGRLCGTVVVPNQIPEDAVAEVRRVGSHPGMVGVLMAANGLGKPFGHPAYHPIYAAAEELDLPIIIHAGPEGSMDSLSTAHDGGAASTYAAYSALISHSTANHVSSLIAQGVFDRHPQLRVLLVGSGAAWVTPFLWKFDTNFKGARGDAPWMTKLPSDYFRAHFKIAAYPVDPVPRTDQLQKYYEALGGFEELLCFASGFPSYDAVEVDTWEELLSSSWQRKVMHDNAEALFSWPSDGSDPTV